MNRFLKEATVKRDRYDTHRQLEERLAAFLDAYNNAKRLKTLRGPTPYKSICKAWADKPDRLRYDPTHFTSGCSADGRHKKADCSRGGVPGYCTVAHAVRQIQISPTGRKMIKAEVRMTVLGDSKVNGARGRIFQESRADERVLIAALPSASFWIWRLLQNPIATFRMNGEPYALLSSPQLIHAVLTGTMERLKKEFFMISSRLRSGKVFTMPTGKPGLIGRPTSHRSSRGSGSVAWRARSTI